MSANIELNDDSPNIMEHVGCRVTVNVSEGSDYLVEVEEDGVFIVKCLDMTGLSLVGWYCVDHMIALDDPEEYEWAT